METPPPNLFLGRRAIFCLIFNIKRGKKKGEPYTTPTYIAPSCLLTLSILEIYAIIQEEQTLP